MRIAICTSDYPVMGETFINRHIEHLYEGNTAVIAGRTTGENPFGKEVFARRHVAVPWTDLFLFPIAYATNYTRHALTRVPYGHAKNQLIEFIKAQKIQLILSEFGTQALAIAPIAKEMNIPIVSYFRGTDASKALRSKRLVRAYRLMFPHLAGIISVSQFLVDNLARHGIRHENTHVIPSGVDMSRFSPAQKRPKSCLAVGRLVDKKAPLTTLKAFTAIAKAHQDAHLTLIGDGPLNEQCSNYIEHNNLSDRITMTGSMSHDAVRAHLAQSQFFLQHSVTDHAGNTEGLPTAIQEAMASGCITISTRHAGIPEAIDEGITGFLCDEHDLNGYIAALNQALCAKDIEHLVHAARQTATQRFDNAILLKRTEQVLESALQDHKRRQYNS